MLTSDDFLHELAAKSGMLPNNIVQIIATAPLRYKQFQIPKRDGSMRDVAQPAREVKLIQRHVVEILEQKLPIHSCVTAYQKGSSVKANAALHLGSSFLLKMDFSKFFPSIRASDIEKHIHRYCPDDFDSQVRRMIARACTWAPNREPPLRLCIGAPSSPLLSNSIMFDFDVAVQSVANRYNVTYSRYADDLTFSSLSKDTLVHFPDLIGAIANSLEYPTLRVNERKTYAGSRASRRTITGVNITPNNELSVGRNRKRNIRAMHHRLVQGKLDHEEVARLTGKIAFVEHIEPGFASKLKRNK